MFHVCAHQRALIANDQGDTGQPFPLMSQCWPKEPMNIVAMAAQQLALTTVSTEFAYHASKNTTCIQGFTGMPYHGISVNITFKQRSHFTEKDIWAWGHTPHYPEQLALQTVKQ